MERVHSLLLLLLSIHQRIWFETGKLCAIYDLEIGSPNLNIEERRDATLSFFLSPSPSYERSSLCHQDKRNRTMILRIAINIWHCEHFIRCDVQLFQTHLQFSFHFISSHSSNDMLSVCSSSFPASGSSDLSLYTFHLNPEMALECELYILLLRYTDYLIICASFGVTKNISSSPF